MNPDFTSVPTASHIANGCAGRIVSRGRNTHAAARRPRRIRGAFEEPNHLASHEDRPSATEASPSNDRMRLSSIFHRIVADNDTQSLNLEVTPFISGVSSATSCFEFEDKKNGRIGRPSEHTAGTHVGPMPFSGAVLSRLFHTTASNAASPSVGRMNRQTPAKPSFGMEPTWGQVHCQDRGECRGQRRRGRFLLLAVVRRTAAGEWPGIRKRGRRVSARPLRSRSPFFPIGSATDPNKAEASFILVLIIFRLPERRETFRFFAACRIAGFSVRHPSRRYSPGRQETAEESPSFPRPLFPPLPPLRHDDLGPGGRPRECLPPHPPSSAATVKRYSKLRIGWPTWGVNRRWGTSPSAACGSLRPGGPRPRMPTQAADSEPAPRAA